MVKAFVLINTEFGNEDSVLDSIKRLQYVIEAYKVYGVYDIVAKVEGDVADKVRETTIYSLKKVDGIKSIMTMVAIENRN